MIFSIAGGVASAVAAFVIANIQQFAFNSSLCPDTMSGQSLTCSVVGVLIPQLVIMAVIALLLFKVFKKYFKYSFLIIFFVLGYAWYLDRTIVWLHVLMDKIGGLWVYYALLFLLGSLLTFLLYFYFVRIKMWLWLKLLIAIVVLAALPLMVLYFDRLLFPLLYPELS